MKVRKGLTVAIAALAIGGLGALGLTPATAAESDTGTVTQGVTAGNLSTAIGDATGMAAVPYQFTQHTKTDAGTLAVDVEDMRGNDAGWALNLTSTDFVYTGSGSPATIPAANITVKPAAPTEDAGNEGADTTNVTAQASGTLHNTNAKKILSAAVDAGQGTYDQNVPFDLTIPAYTSAGSYTATVTVSAVTGP